MSRKFSWGMLVVSLVAAHAASGAELSVTSMSMQPGTIATLVVAGDITNEDTFGVTILVELVPQAGAVGLLEFTVAPPIDIVQLTDVWPAGGTFTPLDTDPAGTDSLVLNGSVDDSGSGAAPVTFSGPLSGFPVTASGGASGVWDVLLTIAVGESNWTGLATTLFDGTITVTSSACLIDADCDDFNDCTSEVCSAGACSNPPLAAGAACGNQSPQGLCDDSDVCDGSGACTANLKAATFVCRPSTDECDPAESCTEVGPLCPFDDLTPDNTACADEGNECTDDICLSGVCSHPSLTDGTLCTDDGNECTDDACSGGVCLHPAKLDDTPCTDDTIECTDDVCTAGACTHPPLAMGTSCGNTASEGVCDNPDTCDGAGVCNPNREPDTTLCRGSTAECDPAEFCDGTSTSCPVDVLSPDETACTDDGDECLDDVCQAGVCTHPPAAFDTPCGDQTPEGACDGPDVCDGGGVCIANRRLSSFVCRASTGECDPAEFCDGVAIDCAADLFTPGGTACGDQSSDICDSPDTCDGLGACQPNNEPSTTECRGSTGECDPAEFCTGMDPACPVQAFTPDGDPCSDDTNDCTNDVCNGGLCIHPPFVADTPCGNQTPTGLCDLPDICDGASVCLPNPKLINTLCRASTEECDPAEFCDGVDGACPADMFAVDGTLCTDDGNDCTDDECFLGLCTHPFLPVDTVCGDRSFSVCDNPDSCDALGTCQPNYEPATTECLASASDCDAAEFCTGSDANCPVDVDEPDGSACAADANDCTDDVCAAGVCSHPFSAIDTACGNQALEGLCDQSDVCDGAGVCLPNYLADTFECRSSADECDPAEFCTGVDGFCPTDLFLADGNLCTDDNNDCTSDSCDLGFCSHPPLAAGAACGDASSTLCDNADSCDDAGVCLPNLEPDTTECRPAAGLCDVSEFCTGSSVTCPPDDLVTFGTICREVAGPCDSREFCMGLATCPQDDFAPSTIDCRAAAGPCDATEACTGSSADCPVDGKAPATTVCRAVAGSCDVEELCDGVNDDCLGDLVEPDTTVCRVTVDVCDVTENCDGVSVDCPADAVEPTSTLCRAAVGDCDAEEFCTGSAVACPTDEKKKIFVECRPSRGVCDVAEFCDAVNDNCPADAVEPVTTMCNAVAGPCDIAEFCDGVLDDCPAELFLNASTECRSVGGLCDVPEFCTGFDADCVPDAFLPLDTECNASTGECDPAETCSGLDAACPPDALLPDGTACTEGGDDCTQDTCLAGVCDHTEYLGACCIGGSCAEIPSTNCLALGGTCVGENTVCGGIRACCLPDGSCDDTLDFACCGVLGGTPHEEGAICLGDLSNPADGVDNLCQLSAFAPCELLDIAGDTTAGGDNFGSTVAISGDLLIVGAPKDDNGGSGSGSAFVFRREGIAWLQEAELNASDSVAGDEFGVEVTIDNGLAIVGAWLDDTAGANAGAAYVYRREGISWIEEAELSPDDIAPADFFGAAVTLRDDVALIGSPGDDDAGSSSGSVYVFRRFGTAWAQQQKLVSDNASAADFFGDSVALGNGLAVIGAPGDDDAGSGAGAVYIFRRDLSAWVLEAKLVALDGAEGAEFGISVSIDGDTVAVGARLDDENGINAGATYIFTRSGTTWSQQAKIMAFDGDASDQFGVSVALKSGLLLVGAIGDDDVATGAGAGYLYSGQGSNWVLEQKLLASTGASGDQLGAAAISDDSAILGAKRADGLGSNSGAAYIYAFTGPDCDENNAVDACELRAIPARDCDANGIIDACEPSFVDADGDGIADACDFCPGVDDAADTDGDGVPDCVDNCNLPNPLQADCDSSGTGDVCELANCSGDPACGDCNANGVPDACDIASSLSLDDNGNGVPDECEECLVNADCDDGIGCTVDVCSAIGGCTNTPDDAVCDDGNSCTDDSCSTLLDCRNIFNPVTCPCETPQPVAAGSRYLAIRPQPASLTTPQKLVVESPNFACLSKFVGYLACGGTGDACRTDADCNACTGSQEPCLTNADCTTCSDQITVACASDSDCNSGAFCISVQTCTLSKLFCVSALQPPPFDIDGDGVIDGSLATLVDDPADALSLSPGDWVRNAQPHCSVSKGVCAFDTDCDFGVCELVDGRPSSVPCSVAAQNCASGFPCVRTDSCILPAVYVTGPSIVPSEVINDVVVATVYEVMAECGALSSPASATMPVWADIADGNGFVNVTDIAFLLLAFQQKYDTSRGITLVAADLTNAAKPCVTEQVINAADLQRILRAFQRETYIDAVTATTAITGCTLPCQ